MSKERMNPMRKGIVFSLFACLFGAAFGAACDPGMLAGRPFDLVPTLGAGDDITKPGSCPEAETEAACSAALTCVWSGNSCQSMDFTLPAR